METGEYIICACADSNVDLSVLLTGTWVPVSSTIEMLQGGPSGVDSDKSTSLVCNKLC